MPNIKEIALNIADKSGAVAYSPAPLRAVRGYSFTFEQLQNFAEALIAELAKGNEPVAWMYEYSYDLNSDKQGHWPVDIHTHVSFSRSKPSVEATPLYALQPTASQIEQETAEACAKYVYSTKGIKGVTNMAESILNGAWKEFKKS